MSAQAEAAFLKTFLGTLAAQPVNYSNDYQQPPEQSLRKVPVLPLDVPPPVRKTEDTAAVPPASITLTFKSTKPPASFTLSVQSTDTISSIKAQLASVPSAPPVEAQRLLLKGKALADSKLLKEYTIKDGDTVNLMVKPGFDWNPTAPVSISSAPPATQLSPASSSPSLSMNLETSGDKRPFDTGLSKPSSQRPAKKHQRIPSVVLSPSPSSESPVEKPLDIILHLDNDPLHSPDENRSSYHAALARPEFWDHLLSFLQSEFCAEDDALQAFEDFLRAGKATMTAHEIAKIRDHVGIMGMAGT